MNLSGSIAISLFMLGGLAYLFSARRLGSKLIIAGIAASTLSPIFWNWVSGACPVNLGKTGVTDTAAVIIAIAVMIAVIVVYLFRRRIFSILFLILAVYLRLSYRIGQRVTWTPNFRHLVEIDIME